jgi:large subunit ribosomal protein L32e
MFMPQKKTKPKFLRPNHGRKSRVRIGSSWRRQRGTDNKKRINKAHMGYSPSIGYGQDKRIKYLHPIGKQEVLVHNLAELDTVDAKTHVVRLSSKLSIRLKQKIVDLAQTRKITVLNSGVSKVSDSSSKFGAKHVKKTQKPLADKQTMHTSSKEQKKND